MAVFGSRKQTEEIKKKLGTPLMCSYVFNLVCVYFFSAIDL